MKPAAERLAALAGAFSSAFGAPPQAVVRAPGRVNLIGEHTDYNDGFVLPMAIDREVRMALRPRSDRRVRLLSVDLRQRAEFDLDRLERGEGWAEYPKGVAWALQERGLQLRGFDGAVSGNVPRGAGLSSSAALELAAARAFHHASGFEWDATAMAVACQEAENRWVGVSSGIMDQLVSACGRRGHALLIDCRSLRAEAVPLPAGTAVLVLDTATRRGLVGSAYNERRRQCEEAARLLGVAALRDASLADLGAAGGILPEVVLRRARHVIGENARTLAAAAAMRQGDARRLGSLMNESHASLRDDFEVSSPALDAISAAARAAPGCYGARMTGAGFGGCAIALVAERAAPAVAKEVRRLYRLEAGREARVYLCRPSDGAGAARPGE